MTPTPGLARTASAGGGSVPGPLAPGVWTIDERRSTVGFAIRHVLVGTVRGRFTSFEGRIEREADSLDASGVVRTESIDTDEKVRDTQLRGPEFFDAERNPEIRFASERVVAFDAGGFELEGPISIAGVTRPVRLRVGVEPGDTPDEAGLRVRGFVRRREFGIEPGGLLAKTIGDRVGLLLDLTAVRESAGPC